MPRIERGLFAGFTLSALLAATGLTQTAGTIVKVPVPGGMYREGVIATSSRDIDGLVTGLTKVGLVSFDVQGNLEGGVAEHWTISDDAKTLHLDLDSRYLSGDLLSILKQQTGSGYWKDAEITAPDAKTLEFHLAEPWAGFVDELVAPIFPYGPYQQTKKIGTDRFLFNTNPHALKTPYIPKVELDLFSDSKNLERALRKGSLDGVLLSEASDVKIPNKWQEIDRTLGRKRLLIFNLHNEQLADTGLRQKLAKGEALSSPMSIRVAVPDVPGLTLLANDLKERWQPLNVTVDIEISPVLTFSKTIIPDRDFDAIILDVDYGPDGDMFPYWHSSQIATPGQNLAGYRNKEVDAFLSAARTEKDAQERQKKFAEVTTRIMNDAIAIDLGSPKVTFARSPKVKGPVPEHFETATSRWDELATWYIKEKRVKLPEEKGQ